MSEQRLHVLEPALAEGRPRLRRHDPAGTGPLFFSFGDIDLLCGACMFLLMAGMPKVDALLAPVVLECPNCSALNESIAS